MVRLEHGGGVSALTKLEHDRAAWVVKSRHVIPAASRSKAASKCVRSLCLCRGPFVSAANHY
jgi:hypothetical protein